MKLYDIPADAEQIELMLTESEGELTPEIEQRIEEFTKGGKEKLEAAACVLKSLEAQAATCKAEMDRLKARRESLESNAEHLKDLMLRAVDVGFNGKVKTALFTIWGQDGPKTATFEMQADADMLQLPSEYLKFEGPKLDTGVLYEKWRSKQELPKEIKINEVEGKRFLRVR